MTDWNFYIDIPFKDKGRDENGCDCWGLAKLIHLRERGVIIPGYEELYETTRDNRILQKIILEERQCRWAEVTKPQTFDFILLKQAGMDVHVGIVTKPGKMIHCAKGENTVHESYTGMKWKNKVAGFYRYEQ